MTTYKCGICGNTFDQVAFDFVLGQLTTILGPFIPRVHEARDALGLRNEDLTADVMAKALLVQSFMCPSCFARSNDDSSFTSMIEGMLFEEDVTDMNLFEWKEIYE